MLKQIDRTRMPPDVLSIRVVAGRPETLEGIKLIVALVEY